MKTFLEIGSCDFNTLRDLCDSGWNGIIVDPHKPFLDNIKDHENLIKINKAVGLYNGKTTYKKISDEYVEKTGDNDYRGMGTITELTPIHTHKKFEGHIETYSVELITIMDLLNSLKINKIDYLKIDAEGMDFDILKSIDYNSIEINLIKMEHKFTDENMVIKFLTNRGFHCELFNYDLIAIKK
jgi:FkbM family methyltransferase